MTVTLSTLHTWRVDDEQGGELMMIARDGGESAASIAKRLQFREDQIEAAFAYAARYREETDEALADNEAAFERLFPGTRAAMVDAASS